MSEVGTVCVGGGCLEGAKTPGACRSKQAVTVGSLVVVCPDGTAAEHVPVPGIVTAIRPDGIYVFTPDGGDAGSERTVSPAQVCLLPKAVEDGLVHWPLAVQYAGRVGGGVLVSALLLTLIAKDAGCKADFARAATILYAYLRALAGPRADGSAEAPFLKPERPDDYKLPLHALLLLRDGTAAEDGGAAQALASCIQCGGRARTVQIQQATRAEPTGDPMDVATQLRALSGKEALAERQAAGLRILAEQQEAMTACAVSPLQALLATVGLFHDPDNAAARLCVALHAAQLSFAPQLLHIAQWLVDAFAARVTVLTTGPAASVPVHFRVVDVGAGTCVFGPALQAAAAALPGNCVVIDYVATNAPSAYDNAALEPFVPAAQNHTCSPADFVRTSLHMVEPPPLSTVRGRKSGDAYEFVRWSRSGTSAVVRKPGQPREYALQLCEAIFCTAVCVLWAPNPDGDDCANFLPEFLHSLLRSPLSKCRGVMLLVVGEGRGGCTGDGDAFVSGLLERTPSLHEAAFGERMLAQLPGTASRATLYALDDVAASADALWNQAVAHAFPPVA